MNRRDAMKAMAAAAVLPAPAPALARATERPARFFEFFSGSGDEEVVAAYSKEEAVELMRSLMLGHRPESELQAVEEISGETLMHDTAAGTEDDPYGPLVTLDFMFRENTAEGCKVPYVICAMNY